eukprot:gene5308-5543_t
MTIPYGAIALLSGLVALVFKAPAVGVQLAGAGGSSGWIAYQMWQRVQAGIAPVPSGILLALSAVLAAFCVYNVVAGGNPPPSSKSSSA